MRIFIDRIFIEGDDYVPTKAIRQDKFEGSREVTDFLVVYFLKTNDCAKS